MPEYDVAVIGSGTAAQNVAPRCAQAGLRVAVVDRLPYGGTCAQRGCDPKKVLLAAAEAVSRARMLDGHGLAGSPAIDWPALIARKRTFTKPVPERIEGWMRDAGAETLHGTARLLGRTRSRWTAGRSTPRTRHRQRRPARGARHPGRGAGHHQRPRSSSSTPCRRGSPSSAAATSRSSSPGSRGWRAPR